MLKKFFVYILIIAAPFLLTAKAKKLPNWAFNIPENCIIGIARESTNIDRMLEAAQQFAAIQKTRNENSFLNKESIRYRFDYKDFTDEQRLKKSQNSVGDLKLLKRNYEKLQLTAYKFYCGYFIGLFAEKKIDKAVLKNIPKQNFPNQKEKLNISGNLIKSFTVKSSADLSKAWFDAFQEARINIISYLKQEVDGMKFIENESSKKLIKISSNGKLNNFKIKNTKIESKFIEGNLSFYVSIILEYKMK